MGAPLAVGLVGLGIHGERYARHLLTDVPGARLEAVCRADAAQGAAWARQHGVRFVADWRDLARDEALEALVVVTPPRITAPVTLAGLAAGKAVLVEKPLAANSVAGSQVVEAAERPGAVLMVAQTLRWNAVVAALLRETASLGRLRVLALSQRLEQMDRPWLEDEEGGGVLLNTGVHAFDLVRHLTGEEVDQVSCQTWRAASRRMPDTFAAVLRTTGGILATVDNCRATAVRSGRIEIAGEGGQVGGDHVHGTLWRGRGRQVESLPPVPQIPTVQAALADFVEVARRRKAPPVTARDGLAAVQVAEACARSHREGRHVKLAGSGD